MSSELLLTGNVIFVLKKCVQDKLHNLTWPNSMKFITSIQNCKFLLPIVKVSTEIKFELNVKMNKENKGDN